MKDDPTITVQGQRVIYNLPPYAAAELAQILARQRGDTGWAQDSKRLLDAALELEARDAD